MNKNTPHNAADHGRSTPYYATFGAADVLEDDVDIIMVDTAVNDVG